MASHFICLANSYKNKGHCIAGILAHKDSGSTNIILDKRNKPIWIRPVCKETNFQAIPPKYAAKIMLFDLVEFDEIEKRPFEHQTENVEINPRSLYVASHCKLSEIFLRTWVSKDPLIFGDCSRYISHKDIKSCLNSLMLIKPDQYLFYAYTKDQARSKFVYNKNCYDLPVTDFVISEMVLSGKLVDTSDKEVYFTLSLGHLYNNNYYKLIAGVLKVDSLNLKKLRSH